MIQALQGWKTYLFAAAMVIAAGLYSQGYISENAYKAISGLLMGGGLAALRAGVAKVTR